MFWKIILELRWTGGGYARVYAFLVPIPQRDDNATLYVLAEEFLRHF